MSNAGTPGRHAIATGRSRRTVWLAASGIAAFALAANLPVLAHDWVYFDDDINVVLNPHLTGLTADSLAWAWKDPAYTRRFMPLGWIAFDGLFRLGGLDPFAYHFASWLLSAANAVALFLVVRRFVCQAPHSAWGDLSAALAVGAMLVHPLRAETAGWASGLLYLTAGLLAACAVLADFPRPDIPRSRVSTWLGPLLFLLSLLVYPVFLGVPLLLILAASKSGETWHDIAQSLIAASKRYGVWLALSGIVGFVNLRLAASSGWFPALIDSNADGFGARLERTVRLLAHYCAETIWPGPSAPFYGLHATEFSPKRILLVLMTAGTAIGFFAFARTRRATARFIAAAGLSLLPFLGLLNREQTASDRFTFLLLAVVTMALADLLTRITRPLPRAFGILAVLVAIFVFCPRYRSSLAVWRDTSAMQTRLDELNAAHPDARLNFARPATYDFLRGEYAAGQRRLREGFSRFGPNPELIAAARFIEETRTKLSGNADDPPMPPFVYLHWDLARQHRAAGHIYAERVHSDYGRLWTTSPTTGPR